MAFDILEALKAQTLPTPLSASAFTELARALFRAQGIGFFILDVAKDELHVDDVILGILGHTEETFDPARPWTDYIHPVDLAAMNERVGTDDDMPLAVVSYRLIRPTGEVRHVDAATVFQTDADGNPTYIIGINRDVTEAAALSQQVARSEQHLADVVENLDAAVFQYTLGADGADHVEFLSPGCERVWGMSAKELTADPSAIWTRIHPDDLAPMQRSIARSAETLDQWRCEYRYTAPSGAEKWLEGRGAPKRLEDGATQWNSLVVDITEAKRLQRELEQKKVMLAESQKLEAIGRITSGVAHDFNNLLAVILGNAELIGMSEPGESVEEEVEQIELASHKGKDLVSSLLSFAGRSVLQESEVDPVASAQECLRLVERTLGDNIAIGLEVEAPVWRCLVDRALFENSILNLCINARDAMPQGGALSLTVGHHTADASDGPRDLKPGRYVRISVQDNGTGISTDDIARVTEPFFTTKAPGSGSGLGLSMVDGFARQSGGALLIDSRLGQGTTAQLFLPAIEPRAPEAPAPHAADSAAPTATRRAVLVEDNAAVGRVFARHLSTLGFEVTLFETAQAALDAFAQSGMPDLLVTDIDLPGGLSGIDLAQRVLVAAPEVGIVLVSGHPRSAFDDVHDLDDRALFLTKPVTRRELADAIREVGR